MRMCILLAACLYASMVCAQAPDSQHADKKILILVPGQPGAPGAVAFLQGFRSSFVQNNQTKVDIYSEHLNLQQFPNPQYEPELVSWLKTKYSGIHFDVVIAGVWDSLKFAEKYRDVLWPGTPVIFCVVDETNRADFPPGFTGINMPISYITTVRSALQMQPETTTLAIVCGSSRGDLANCAYAEEQLKPLLGLLRLIRIADVSLEEAARRLSDLPSNTIVLVVSFYIDAKGQQRFPTEFYKEILPRCSKPIYDSNQIVFGLGTVGGELIDYQETGREVADLATRILKGESASSIKPYLTRSNHLMFDWRQLKRFGIDKSKIPVNSRIEFKTPTFWESYQWRIVGALGLILLQGLLIAVLLAEKTRRKRAQQSERRSEELSHSVLNSIKAQVGVIDNQGTLLAVNESWTQAENSNGNRARETQNYLSEDWQEFSEGETAKRARTGVNSVLQNHLKHFSLEYSHKLQDDLHYFEMLVEPLKSEEGGAIISHVDITERRRAELEAQQKSRELAHLGRASAMGELASSLAHELNQPLTAILSNAQAASRILFSDVKNVAEVQDALSDIAEEDMRAGEIIQRMRGLLKKEEVELSSVSLNHAASVVLRLAAHESLLRRVPLISDLAPDTPPIYGNMIQLEQVVLNLVMNAMDAFADQHFRERFVKVTTFQNDSEIHLSVSDSGKGISEEQLKHIFDPFFTTKSEGLGMGLSITRSIIQAHGGRIWVQSEPAKGSTFYCAFPVAQ